MRTISLVWLWLLVAYYGYSQPIVSKELVPCNLAPVAASDSLKRQVAVDSIRNLLVGEWELVKIERGWTKPVKPSIFTKITFSKTGYTEYWEKGEVVSKCYINIVWRLGYFWYTIRDLQGKKFIHLAPKSLGRIVLCDTKLGINNSQGDGEALLFERLSPLTK